uniref:VWFA domain-containing protein n=1 Tax=Histophilus somni (strain 129Pt) TaxID=205914 RepID=Q0I303_HISS1
MRRLPIFLVVDVSESMAGDSHRQMQEAINRLVQRLRCDPYALESVYISVIAFAGAAGVIAPLTELMSFYAPRLPMGSGTSLGAALNLTMDEIQRNVVRSSGDQKGDFKPLVYILSDGVATDDPTSAIQRWQQEFKSRTKLIAVGLGNFADLSALNQIAELTFRIDDQDLEEAYLTLTRSIEDSILSQSRSLGVAPLTIDENQSGVSLIKNEQQAVGIDENYAILTGLCRKEKLPYLMKYERQDGLPAEMRLFRYVGTYPAEKDFEDWSDHRPNESKVKASELWGGGGCPHCGSAFGLAVCAFCDQIFCIDGEGKAICPKCEMVNEFVAGKGESVDFEINRSRG